MAHITEYNLVLSFLVQHFYLFVVSSSIIMQGQLFLLDVLSEAPEWLAP